MFTIRCGRRLNRSSPKENEVSSICFRVDARMCNLVWESMIYNMYNQSQELIKVNNNFNEFQTGRVSRPVNCEY